MHVALTAVTMSNDACFFSARFSPDEHQVFAVDQLVEEDAASERRQLA